MEQTPHRYHVHYGPPRGWARVDLRELWRYRDLVMLFVKRDFTVWYKQTLLGPAWVLLNPLLSTAMYTVMFGVIADLPTGDVPKPLFYLAGTALWGLFSTSVTRISTTFTANNSIVSKVYFPRLSIPVSTMLSSVINFAVQFLMLFVLVVYYAWRGMVHPNWALLPLLIPVVLEVGMLGLGCGIIVSSLTTRYRDLAVVVTVAVQLWMYGTPVVYPLSMIDGMNPALRLVLHINPMAAPMETFRVILLGSGQIDAATWGYSIVLTVLLLLGGLALFGKVEQTFVDTV